MGNLDEIRNTTKKLLREGTPTSVEYEKALPLCKGCRALRRRKRYRGGST